MRQFKVISGADSAARRMARHGTDRWLSAASSQKLARQPIVDRSPAIILPGLPPESGDTVVEGPLINPLDQSGIEQLPEVTSGPPDWTRIARRSMSYPKPKPDARDPRLAISSSVPKESSTRTTWCPPETLYAQLNELTDERRTAAWAEQAVREVRHLGKAVEDRPGLVPVVCARLRRSIERAERLADGLNEPTLATRLRRASYALRRRLDIWERVLPSFDSTPNASEVDMDQFCLVLSEVDAVFSDAPQGRAWREYLLLEALREVSKNADAADADRRKALARRVLGRVTLAPLNETQRSFLASEPLDRLAVALRQMASGPPDRASLLSALERYEETGLASDARRLADEFLWLDLGSEDRLKDLHRRVTMHYRNANLRMVIDEHLLNRLMPERLPEYEKVHDTILGNPVHGESLTATEVGIRLIPDARRLRLALEITGEVAALTSSKNGAAVFHNSSESRYVARKPMELTTDGLTLWPAEVGKVDNTTRLRRLRTVFDGVPLVGVLIQNVARTQHDLRRSDLRREIERKVATRAKRRIDDEANARLSSFSEKLEERVLDPMHDLSIGPNLVEAKTTKDNLTMRLRVASPRQLGAHTPRPIAPADSLANIQVHQTALNNLVERLALDGKTFALPELRSRLARQLNWPELEQRSTNNDDVVITFAKKDAVRVTCAGGRITIDLAIAKLRKAPRTWRDFHVRVHYRPRVEGLSAELVRDGVIQLPQTRVRTSSQIALRSIFSKLFSKNRTRQLVPDRIRNHPKMDDLAVTQMTIEDGWIAVALGPKPRLARATKPAAGKMSPLDKR